MSKLKSLMAALFAMLMLFGATSCEKDEPGSNSSHDYLSAYVMDGDTGYWWVIDMDNESTGTDDGKFKIQAWTEDGKKMSGKKTYSGKYSISNTTVYVAWDGSSGNTMWRFTDEGIVMIGSGNPAELSGLTFYYGVPDFD